MKKKKRDRGLPRISVICDDKRYMGYNMGDYNGRKN